MIGEMHLLEKAPDWVPLRELEPAQLLLLDEWKVYYWRYVQTVCFVKASSFAPQKVNWIYGGPTPPPGYVGDCGFYVQYGARYQGDIDMPDNKTITDAWKKNMAIGVGDDLSQPYYQLWQPTGWDCSDPNLQDDYRTYTCRGEDAGTYSPCDSVEGSYDKTTGSFNTIIGGTPGEKWSCGVDMGILTKSGADLSVLSPKPGVTHSVVPTPPSSYPGGETGKTYELWINMKGFGIKSPALSKQSAWNNVWWYLEAPDWQADGDTGMWPEHIDPGWYENAWPDEHLGAPSWGGAEWYAYNPGWNRNPPSNPKALLQPSSVSLNYKKSDTTVAPNSFNEAANTGFLYHAWMDIGYMYKGISFIVANEPSFSGNPENIQPVQSYHEPDGWTYVGPYWDLILQAAYPDFTCAWSCEPP